MVKRKFRWRKIPTYPTICQCLAVRGNDKLFRTTKDIKVPFLFFFKRTTKNIIYKIVHPEVRGTCEDDEEITHQEVMNILAGAIEDG